MNQLEEYKFIPTQIQEELMKKVLGEERYNNEPDKKKFLIEIPTLMTKEQIRKFWDEEINVEPTIRKIRPTEKTHYNKIISKLLKREERTKTELVIPICKIYKLLPKYHELIQRLDLRINAKIIIVTGAVAAGKTTFTKNLEQFLEERHQKIIRVEGLPDEISESLALMNKNKEKYAFARQMCILQEYQKKWYQLKLITEIDKSTYILMDRTFIDTIIFENIYIKNLKERKILENIRQQLKEALHSNNVDTKYLEEIYSSYEKNILKAYPTHIEINNNHENLNDMIRTIISEEKKESSKEEDLSEQITITDLIVKDSIDKELEMFNSEIIHEETIISETKG
ncbi:6213_t:CDS:2 [Ambispora leptoticha]|uniref:6213_t:CDS:1 n=1 Tax=Ambispora leptoticha TaxID=144679 RepID=A0A9N9G738_9GLOM|nr:6213_t:CDS:2 [Ambispora leptoticha]